MPHRSTGFSLIEVTVAIALIALMIVTTSVLLQRLPVGGREVRDQDLALKIARAQMETLRAGGYDAVPASGPFTNALLSSLASSTALLTVGDYNSDVKQVEVTVSWRGADAVIRFVSLTTLITSESGLP
jgi:prepilin-type N-terminal cleavage/methylation domain-containing protein